MIPLLAALVLWLGYNGHGQDLFPGAGPALGDASQTHCAGHAYQPTFDLGSELTRPYPTCEPVADQ